MNENMWTEKWVALYYEESMPEIDCVAIDKASLLRGSARGRVRSKGDQGGGLQLRQVYK